MWEVRPSLGSNNNGGGFDSSVTSPGTDFSQQNSAQFAFTDGVIATTAFTSVSHSFISSDVGNLINISSAGGGTVGFYTIISVSAGIATLDRSAGTGTGATWALGGALSTIQPLVTTSGYGGVANAVLANVIYIKATGTITLTSAIAMSLVGPISFIGYTSTRTDNGHVTITTATNSTQLFQPANLAVCIWQNITFTNTAGTSDHCIESGSNSLLSINFINCLMDGFTRAISVAGSRLTMFNCEVRNCTASDGALFLIIPDCYFHACYFHTNTAGASVYITSLSVVSSMTFIDTAIYGNSIGVRNLVDNFLVALSFVNCVIASNTGDGIESEASSFNAQHLHLTNTIIDGNGGFGVHLALPSSSGTIPSQLVIGANNAFRANTSGNRSHCPILPGDITLTADPFTARSSGDFTLNNTAGGGAACKAAGFQSTLI